MNLILSIFLVFRKLFGLIIGLVIIRNSKSLNKDIPWIVLVLLFPLIGSLIYLILGSDIIQSNLLKRISDSFQRCEEYFVQDKEIRNGIERKDNRALKYLLETGNFPITKGNKVEYYKTGELFFERVKKELKSAKKFIFIEFFSIEIGQLWGEVLEILKEKIEEGVEVRFIYDNMACIKKIPSKYYEKLEALGIQCEPFFKNCRWFGAMRNHHNHRKCFIIDGGIAFTGGMNIEDRYVNLEQPYGYWKDVGISVAGEGVWNFTVMFLRMWNVLRGDEDDYTKYQNQLLEANHELGYVVSLGDNPLDEETVGKNTYISMIHQAQRSLSIFTPYLILDMDMYQALALAAKRGVDVSVVIPGIPDKREVYQISLMNARKLLKEGVKVYTYTPGFMHGKVFLVDDMMAMVGTMNTDYRSLYFDFEYGVLVEGVSAIDDIKQDVVEVLQKSVPVTLKRFNFLRFLWEAILQLLAPLM